MIPQVGHDHRRGLVEQNRRPRERGVRHQIDEQVEPVVRDAARGGQVVSLCQRDERIHRATKARGRRVLVFRRGKRVTVEGDPRAIVLLDNREQQAAHHMIAEICREVAHAQRTGVRWDSRRERRQVAAIRLLQAVVRAIERMNRRPRHVEILETRHDPGHQRGVLRLIRPAEHLRQVPRHALIVAFQHCRVESGRDAPRRRPCLRLERSKITRRVVVATERDLAGAQRKPDVLVGRRQRPGALEAGQREIEPPLRGKSRRQIDERLDRVAVLAPTPARSGSALPRNGAGDNSRCPNASDSAGQSGRSGCASRNARSAAAKSSWPASSTPRL